MKNKLIFVLLSALLISCHQRDEAYVQRVNSIPLVDDKSPVIIDKDHKVTVEHHAPKHGDVTVYSTFRINTDDVAYLLVHVPAFRLSTETVIAADKLDKGKQYRFENFGVFRFLTKSGEIFHVEPTLVKD